ncbi:MAG: type II toxin-antitoxin system Phd/YefM family antitoxin [Rhodoferax sp.]|nr:type II toxin-antitoxin system Phd/YefM family antitoxin [Rhodoferax sp.]
MKLSTQIKPISYLKSHAAQIVKELGESRQPLVITQNGEATMVVIDVKSYEERENTLALLKLLAIGNSQIEQGKFRDAEDVFADLDKIDLQ